MHKGGTIRKVMGGGEGWEKINARENVRKKIRAKKMAKKKKIIQKEKSCCGHY